MNSNQKEYDINEALKQLKQHDTDTGSPGVQIALAHVRMKYLSSILHKKDLHSRRGLGKVVARFRKMSEYMRKNAPIEYQKVKNVLGLRK